MDESTTAEEQTQPKDTAERVSEHKDVSEKKMLIGVLSYISILVVAAYLMGKDDPSTHFHIKQGVVLFVIEIATWVILTMIPFLFPILALVHIGLVVLAIIGIINALRTKEKELPLVGGFAKHVPF